MAEPYLILGVGLLLTVCALAAAFIVWALVRQLRRIARLPEETERRVRALFAPLLESGALREEGKGAIGWKLVGAVEGRPVVAHIQRGWRASLNMSLLLHIRMPDRNPTAVGLRKRAAARVLAPFRGSVTISGNDLFCMVVVPLQQPDASELVRNLARAAGS